MSRHKTLGQSVCVSPGTRTASIVCLLSRARGGDELSAGDCGGKTAQKFLSLATVVVILLSVNSAVKQYKSYRRQNLYEKYYNELSADKSE
jgi:hypothetical protein